MDGWIDGWMDGEELIKWIDRFIENGVARRWVALGSAGFRWFAMICRAFGNEESSAKRITFAHGSVQNRIRPQSNPKAPPR